MRRVRDDLGCVGRLDLDCIRSMSFNPIANPRVNHRGDDWEGLVTQSFLLQISVASVRNFYFLPVTSMSSYLWIACRIAFCVIRILWVCFIISSVIDFQPFIVSSSAFKLFRFSLVNIVFSFSPCLLGVMGVWLKVSTVMLWASASSYKKDSIYCIYNIIIRQWCTITIISIFYGSEQFYIVFISWGFHARSFTRCVNPVQEILPTFGSLTTIVSYVTVGSSCSAPFFASFYLYIFLIDIFWFAFLRRNFINDNALWFFLVRRTDLR